MRKFALRPISKTSYVRNTVTNSIKTFKMVHTLKKKRERLEKGISGRWNSLGEVIVLGGLCRSGDGMFSEDCSDAAIKVCPESSTRQGGTVDYS